MSSFRWIWRLPDTKGIKMKTLAVTTVLFCSLNLGAGVHDSTANSLVAPLDEVNSLVAKQALPETHHTDWRTGCFIFFC